MKQIDSATKTPSHKGAQSFENQHFLLCDTLSLCDFVANY